MTTIEKLNISSSKYIDQWQPKKRNCSKHNHLLARNKRFFAPEIAAWLFCSEILKVLDPVLNFIMKPNKTRVTDQEDLSGHGKLNFVLITFELPSIEFDAE